MIPVFNVILKTDFWSAVSTRRNQKLKMPRRN